MLKFGTRACKTEYFENQFLEKKKNKPDEIYIKGQEAKKNLCELSATEQQSDPIDHLHNWIKFNEISIKSVKDSKRLFEYPLQKLRTNTLIIPRNQLLLKKTKWRNNDDPRKTFRNVMKTCSKSNSNCNSVSLKLNMTKQNQYQRIHSHSVRLDTTGKIKVQPKIHFHQASISGQSKVVFTKTSQKNMISKTVYSKRTNKIQNIMLSHKKRASLVSLSEISQAQIQAIHIPNNLIQYKKFIGILHTLRNYERQNYVKCGSAIFQNPSKMKGSLRKSRLSTF